MGPLPRPGILDIDPYVGGESALAGFAHPIKLASNEGALGPSPKALAAYHAAAARLHIYPDGDSRALREAIARRHGLEPARIVCGAGSDQILQLLASAYAGPGDEVIYTRHCFSMYPVITLAVGATPVVTEEVELTASVDNILAAVTPRTRLVFLANPNNPTGTYLPADEVERLVAGLPRRVLLVLDSAYAEFVGRNDYDPGAGLVARHDNVVMTRTFSKIYGMGGMRLGWGYCPPAVADVLNRVREPFNVSGPAQAAGIAALEDGEFTALARAHNDYWQPWLANAIEEIGIMVSPGVCNFVLARFGSGARALAADAHLRSRGLIVRRMGGYGLPDALRITVGRDDENRALVAALAEFQGRRDG